MRELPTSREPGAVPPRPGPGVDVWRHPSPAMDRRLREALAGDHFVLYCQPIVELETGKVSQQEILLRLLENNHHVGPEFFLAAAERFGMVREIDRMVVADAISILESGGAGTLDVNLSGASLGDPELLKLIDRELKSTGVDPQRLVIEVTETAAIADMGAAIDFAKELHRLGCKLALDDFGVGFGSLYYLKHLPLDYLKIDGEFVRNLTSSARDRAMVAGMVTMAHNLGLRTVAEFVADVETVEMLRDLEVDYGQGYHFGEPQLAPEVRRHSPPSSSNGSSS
jgi:EAL domain-containing protein (putative c-di-GMP-specific phosphodiesterase class I)